MNAEDVLRGLYEETLVGNGPRVLELTEAGLGIGMGAPDAVVRRADPLSGRGGRPVRAGRFFVPEMLIAGRAMAGAMERLRPLLVETGVETSASS